MYSFDERYVQRLKARDPIVQRHFVDYFSQLLVIKLRARFLPPDVIDDIRQETFARVLVILGKDHGIDHPERLGAFVNSVCNNVIFERYRSNNRTDSIEEGDEPPDMHFDLDRGLISEDAKRAVRQVLEGMTERDRRLLEAVFLEERSKDEICREFGVDRDYLRVLLHRAKIQFKAKYTEAGLPGLSTTK